MSKHKDKMLVGILSLILMIPVSYTSGSIISDITNLYNSAKQMSTLQDSFNPKKIGGIYDSHLQIAQEGSIVAGSESIDTIFNNYSSLPACHTNKSIQKDPRPLKKTDIITILLQSSADTGWLHDTVKNNDKEKAAKEIKNSCERLLTCMGETQTDINLCKKTIEQDYKIYNSQAAKKQSLTTDFYGTQFYSNGTLEDSAYDLMVDIQHIGDIMYSNNKEPNKVTYYRMPTTASSPLPQTPTSGNSDKKSAISGKGNSSSTPDKSQQNPDQITIQKDNPDARINIGGRSSGNKKKTSNHANNPSKTPKTEKKIPKTSTPSLQATTGAPLFGSSICLPEDTIHQEEETPETTTPPLRESEELTPEEIDDIRQQYIEHINGQYTSYEPTKPSPDSLLTPPSEGESNSIGSALSDMGMMDAINKCINTCNDTYSGIDALTCKASCLCDTVPKDSNQAYNQFLDYKIKFCWIPTQTKAPYTSILRVQSIEEIVDAMNTTLMALRQSGALNKRNETQEYLDTSLRNLNIGNSFVFSFNIAFKSNTNTKSSKDIQNDADKAFAQATKKSLIYQTNNTNKYSLDTIKHREQNTNIQKKIDDSVATIDSIINRQTATAEMLQKNNEFWRQFELSVQDLITISKNMRKKAENAQ